MDITFIGATRGVTGSSHLFEVNNHKFLIECGLYQGHREEADRINRTFPFEPKDLKAVLLTHAHLDHSGNLPTLIKNGYAGPIYCTSATKDIVSLLLMDSASIQEHDIEYVNKKHRAQGLPEKMPLYTSKDVEKTVDQFAAKGYETDFELLPGVRATLYDAGHILGSAQILLEVSKKRLLFSGDLGRKNMPIIRDPVIPHNVDYLILESTYGGRTHTSVEETIEELRAIINEGKRRRSKMIIPAFAVERTQLLISILKELYAEGTLANVPVYIDSPLATDVTEIYKKHPECFDAETYTSYIKDGLFDFPGLIYIRDSAASKKLNKIKEPMIIIAGSGMCEGGRVVHHLIHSIEDPDNILILVGFQAQGTLGRKILDNAERIFIFGERYQVRARIKFLGGLSAHADGKDLIDYVALMSNARLKRVFLIHGEPEAAMALKESIAVLDRTPEVLIPQSLTRVEV